MAKFQQGERVRVFFRNTFILSVKDTLIGFPGKIKGYQKYMGYEVELDDGSTEKNINQQWIESEDNPETTFRSIIRALSEAPAMKRRFSLRYFCSESAGFYETKYPNSLFDADIVIRANGLVESEEYMQGEELEEIAKASIAAQKLYEDEHGKEDA